MWNPGNRPDPAAQGGACRWTIDDGDPRGLSRRQFLQRGLLAGASVATASIWWKLLESPAFAATGEAALPSIETFLGKDQVRELLRIALSKGGEFAEVYGEYTLNSSFNLDEGSLKEAQYGVMQGVGIRVITGEQTGYAYADEFGMTALREAAAVAAAVARTGAAAVPQAFNVSRAVPPFVLQSPAPLASSEEQRIALVRRLDEAARGYDPRIRQVFGAMQDSAKAILVANSEGLWEADRQFISRLLCSATAIDGTNRQSASSTAGGQVNADYFEAVATPEQVGRDAASGAIALLGAVEPRAGSYPVVLAPGWGGVLVHECFGHSLEGDGIRKKSSIRAFQLGEKVCADVVDIYDDGTVSSRSVRLKSASAASRLPNCSNAQPR
jgi:TldD protein